APPAAGPAGSPGSAGSVTVMIASGQCVRTMSAAAMAETSLTMPAPPRIAPPTLRTAAPGERSLTASKARTAPPETGGPGVALAASEYAEDAAPVLVGLGIGPGKQVRYVDRLQRRHGGR